MACDHSPFFLPSPFSRFATSFSGRRYFNGSCLKSSLFFPTIFGISVSSSLVARFTFHQPGPFFLLSPGSRCPVGSSFTHFLLEFPSKLRFLSSFLAPSPSLHRSWCSHSSHHFMLPQPFLCVFPAFGVEFFLDPFTSRVACCLPVFGSQVSRSPFSSSYISSHFTVQSCFCRDVVRLPSLPTIILGNFGPPHVHFGSRYPFPSKLHPPLLPFGALPSPLSIAVGVAPTPSCLIQKPHHTGNPPSVYFPGSWFCWAIFFSSFPLYLFSQFSSTSKLFPQ